MADDIRGNGWEDSTKAWVKQVDEKDVNRKLVLDKVVLPLCSGSAKGIDVGCGEGRFTRMLKGQGVDAVGLDYTTGLIETAKARDPKGHYIRANAEQIPFKDNLFDLVVSYLVLIDVIDFRKAISEMVRILQPGGKLVVANLSSFITTSANGWLKDENGAKICFPVDHYLEERGDIVSWADITILNYHRPLEAYMKSYLDNGLRLEFFSEPGPTKEESQTDPLLADLRRMPYCNVMVWRK